MHLGTHPVVGIVIHIYVKLKFNGPLESGMFFILPHDLINQLTNQSIFNVYSSIHPSFTAGKYMKRVRKTGIL